MLVSFFFSSRRWHTRSLCDWSSDVCSSDLDTVGRHPEFRGAVIRIDAGSDAIAAESSARLARERSEERRVGKECRCRWRAARTKQKRNEVEREAREGCRKDVEDGSAGMVRD